MNPLDAAGPSADGECMQTTRQRLVAWNDPHELAAAAQQRTGLEFLQAIASGELAQPPIGDVLGFRLTHVVEGQATFTTEMDERHFNLIGSVHGGLPATLIDSASGCAVYSTLAREDAWTTVHLDIDYLRPLPGSGPVTCTGRVVRVGRRIGVADAEIIDADGRVCARGSSRCLIVRGG